MTAPNPNAASAAYVRDVCVVDDENDWLLVPATVRDRIPELTAWPNPDGQMLAESLAGEPVVIYVWKSEHDACVTWDHLHTSGMEVVDEEES